MPGTDGLDISNDTVVSCTCKQNNFRIVWIVVYHQHIVFAITVCKSVPSFSQGAVGRSWTIIGSLVCLLWYLLHVSHFPITISMSLLILGQYTPFLALLLHFFMPRCPSCNLWSQASGFVEWQFYSLSITVHLPHLALIWCDSISDRTPWVSHCECFPSLFVTLYRWLISFALQWDTGNDSTIMWTW